MPSNSPPSVQPVPHVAALQAQGSDEVGGGTNSDPLSPMRDVASSVYTADNILGSPSTSNEPRSVDEPTRYIGPLNPGKNCNKFLSSAHVISSNKTGAFSD